MSETKLEKARAYEEAAGSKVPTDLRPRYHLSSRCGWMNDPNGFSFYGGKYHMFYQYYPYDNKWGPMHWAHAESTDLLHWDRRGTSAHILCRLVHRKLCRSE